MSEKKINIQCSKYGKIFDRLKYDFLKSVSLKFSAQKLNDPIYTLQIGRCGLLYIHVKKGREPPHFFKS